MHGACCVQTLTGPGSMGWMSLCWPTPVTSLTPTSSRCCRPSPWTTAWGMLTPAWYCIRYRMCRSCLCLLGWEVLVVGGLGHEEIGLSSALESQKLRSQFHFPVSFSVCFSAVCTLFLLSLCLTSSFTFF